MEKKIKVGIVGLGLIGASILKGLYEKGYELYTHSNSSFLKASKYSKSDNDIKILKDCDIIFVATSVEKTLETLDKLDGFLDKKTIVVDVCSIKKNLIDKKYNFNFILSHPMAGSEKTGFDASDKNLFDGAKWLFEKENEILIKIIKDLGAIPFKIDMKNHDKLCAQISHIPAILSFLLFENASNEAKLIASSGFRDTTRLAMTSPDILINMFNLNIKNILEGFKNIEDKLNDLKNMTDDEKINLFKEINLKRKEMYDNFGKNIFQI